MAPDPVRVVYDSHHPMLHVHRADRADALVDALGELLAVAPADPFAGEVVGVPTRGMERWLTQSLSLKLGAGAPGRTDGIVANVAFPSPRDITEQAIAAAHGIDPRTDPWSRHRVVWPLLQVVDENLDQAWLGLLAEHLRDSAAITPTDDAPRPQRLVAVRHLAHLFDRYATHRPQMLTRWAAGDDVDGSGVKLPRHTAWQAELWRRLRAAIDGPDPAERLNGTARRIADDPTLLDLPERLSLFGLTRLPASHLQLLEAIAATRDVHLFLLHPSPQLWQRVAPAVQGLTVRRAQDPTATIPRNRLLGSWGRDARELQLVLGPRGPQADHPHATADAAHPPQTLLQRLQHDVRHDVHAPGPPLPGAPDTRPPLDDHDRSVEVHSCHGRARQVEVLRDAILHVLKERPELQPRDVIVMCPDIETFAPLIHATFGVGDIAANDPDEGEFGDEDDEPSDVPVPPDLRVRLADRALRQTNPVLGAVGRLLELADQRLTASQVLDLADREPVRRRLRLDDDALARLEDWVAGTNIRWGLDAAHRAPFKLAKIDANTWRAGLDRVLLGVTMTEDDQRLVHGVLPFDDVESGAIDLVGRFAEFVDRLQSTVDRFARPQTITGWATEISTAADLLTATAPKDAWQRAGLDRLLADLVQEAGRSTATIALPELRDLLTERLAGRPTRTNFRTGHLTFCTLAPMRSVPHAVVCLLGLDDTAFPRKAPQDGDDLIVADAHVGDHDGRSEDRQMLLDALLAAKDKLIVTYTGNDERTNAARPPAVPVGELLDVVDRTVRPPDGSDHRTARDAVTIRHPLQPFDPRNFVPGRLHPDAPFSFDHVTLQGARALTHPREPKLPFLTHPLPAPEDEGVVELDHLIRFVQHPAKAFLKQRLGISLSTPDDEGGDALPIELDGLQLWAVGDRMLAAMLRGQEIKQTVFAERARGALPPDRLADTALRPLTQAVPAVAGAAMELLDHTTDLGSLDARVLLPGGRRLSGTVPGLDGDTVQLVTYSRLGPKHRLAAWVRLLALTAAYPDREFHAVTVGRPRSTASRNANATIARIAPVGHDVAIEQLRILIDLFDRGRRERPPLACATSAAYAEAIADDRDPIGPATNAWESAWNFPKEDADAEHVQLLGGIVPLTTLLDDPPRAEEHGDGWDTTQPSRFGRWSLRLWAGLLAHEEVTDR